MRDDAERTTRHRGPAPSHVVCAVPPLAGTSTAAPGAARIAPCSSAELPSIVAANPLEFVISGTRRDSKRTPLYDRHVQLGARLMDFAGWSLPVQYDGVIKEHERVRTAAGVFDVSHMGELFFRGPGARATLDHLAANDVAGLVRGHALYTPLCNEQGGVLDDVLVYCVNDRFFMMVVNAANTDKIVSWSQQHLRAETELEDVSDRVALLALQGPRSRDILTRVPAFQERASELEALEYYRVLGDGNGDVLFLSRTGYTGELGYELYVHPERAASLWDEILAAGEEFGVGPAGLGARDTLRFEVGFCLYGHELGEQISPLEAGLGWTVKLTKGEFVGKTALAHQKERGVPRRLVGLAARERVIARAGYDVRAAGRSVGAVTSGTFAPTLKRSLAMALVQREALGGDLTIVVRGREVPVERVRLPFYRPNPPQ